MADADDALHLLLTDDPFEAAELARRLDERNAERREADAATLELAIAMVEQQGGVGDRHALVLCSEQWHPGVIGIVASRLVERFHLPTVLVALDGTEGRGSARSIEGFDLYDALTECSDYLVEFGGHPYAAGLNVARSRLDAFTKAFEDVARHRLSHNEIGPVIHVDYEIRNDDLTGDLLEWLKRLEPYGARNRRPIFMLCGARLQNRARRVGSDGCHLKMVIQSTGARPFDVIGFNLGDRIEETEQGELDLVFAFEENEFRGIRRPQLRLRDMRPATP
jgi:single-stranded-DNA-specific exonuclease